MSASIQIRDFIYDQVKHIIENLINTKIEIKCSSRLKYDLNIDSLSFSQLIYQVQSIFCITLQYAEISKLDTVNDLINIVYEKFIDK